MPQDFWSFQTASAREVGGTKGTVVVTDVREAEGEKRRSLKSLKFLMIPRSVDAHEGTGGKTSLNPTRI